MTSSQKNWLVFLIAAGLTGFPALAYLNHAGFSDDNILLTLRVSARAALVVLLIVFVARPMRQLAVTPMTQSLLKNRRLIGVAFAGIHTAHLGLIMLRADQVAAFDLFVLNNSFGAIVYLTIYAMFVTSFDRPARAIGPKTWRRLHKAGLYLVFVAFAQTLLPPTLDRLGEVNWPLVALTAGAIVIRLTAWLAKRRR